MNDRPVPASVPERLAALAGAHRKTFQTVGDEVWSRNPVCEACLQVWPCPVQEMSDLIAMEIAHRLNPVIGWLRLVDDKHPNDLVATAIQRVDDTVNFVRDTADANGRNSITDAPDRVGSRDNDD